MSWLEAARRGLGEALGVVRQGRDADGGGSTEEGDADGGGADGGGVAAVVSASGTPRRSSRLAARAASSSAREEEERPPAPMVDINVVAVFARSPVAGTVRLRFIGRSGMEGEPVAGRSLFGSQTHEVMQFAARGPASRDRWCRLTFVRGADGEARERDARRSAFVRVIEPSQQQFLGLVCFQDDEWHGTDGLQRALAAYALYALQTHSERGQAVQVMPALRHWRAIIHSLHGERKTHRGGPALMQGREQVLLVTQAACVVVSGLIRQLAPGDDERVSFSRSILLLMMLGEDARHTLRSLSRDAQEVLAHSLVPASASTAGQLTRELHEHRVLSPLFGCLCELMVQLVASEQCAWLRLVPLLCHVKWAMDGVAWVVDESFAARIRQHGRCFGGDDVKMARVVCSMVAGDFAEMALEHDRGRGVYHCILRCSSLRALAGGTLALCAKHFGSDIVPLVDHVAAVVSEGDDAGLACAIIEQLAGSLAPETEDHCVSEAVLNLVERILSVQFREPGSWGGVMARRCRVVAAALCALHKTKPAGSTLRRARGGVVRMLRDYFERVRERRQRFDNPAKLYEILLPKAPEGDAKALVVPLQQQLRHLPAEEVIDVLPRLLDNTQQIVRDIATEEAMQAITEICADARAQQGLFTRLWSFGRDKVWQTGRALSVLFNAGCPPQADDLHTNVLGLVSWAMWPTFLSLPDDVVSELHRHVQNRIRDMLQFVQDLCRATKARTISVQSILTLCQRQNELRSVLSKAAPEDEEGVLLSVDVAKTHVDVFKLEHARVVCLCDFCDTVAVADVDRVRALLRQDRNLLAIDVLCNEAGECIFFREVLVAETREILCAVHALSDAQTFLSGAWQSAAREYKARHGGTQLQMHNAREIFDVALKTWQDLAHAVESGCVISADIERWFGAISDGEQLEAEFVTLARTSCSLDDYGPALASEAPAWTSVRAGQVRLLHKLQRLKANAAAVVFAARVLKLSMEADSAFQAFDALVQDSNDFGQLQLSGMNEAMLGNVQRLDEFGAAEIEALKVVADVCVEGAAETTLLDFLGKDDIFHSERFKEFEQLATAQAQSTKETTIITLLAKTRTALNPVLGLRSGGEPATITAFLSACQPHLAAQGLADAIRTCAAELSWLEDRLKTVKSTVSSAAREELQRVVNSGTFCVAIEKGMRAITDEQIERDCRIACVRFTHGATGTCKSLESLRSMQAKLTLLGDEDDAEDVKNRVEYLSRWIDGLRRLAQAASRAKGACLPCFDNDYEMKSRFGVRAPTEMYEEEKRVGGELSEWGQRLFRESSLLSLGNIVHIDIAIS